MSLETSNFSGGFMSFDSPPGAPRWQGALGTGCQKKGQYKSHPPEISAWGGLQLLKTERRWATGYPLKRGSREKRKRKTRLWNERKSFRYSSHLSELLFFAAPQITITTEAQKNSIVDAALSRLTSTHVKLSIEGRSLEHCCNFSTCLVRKRPTNQSLPSS